MGTCSSDTDTPRRLLRHRGGWVLETRRLVSRDGMVFEPKCDQIAGVIAILAQLRATGHNQLARSAEVIMNRDGGNAEWQESRDGAWVPTGRTNSFVADLARQRNGAAVARQANVDLTELRAELMFLRQAHRSLQGRVDDLQRQVKALAAERAGSNNRPHSAGLPHPAQNATSGGSQASSSSSSSTASEGNQASSSSSSSTAGIGVPPAGTAGVSDPAQAASAAPQPQAAASPSPPTPGDSKAEGDAGAAEGDAGAADGGAGAAELSTPPMKLPTLKVIEEQVSALIGDEVTFTEEPKAVASHVSLLLDRADEPIAAIATNDASAARLGGVMLMLPDAQIEDQVKSKKACDDALEAMSEVCNVLTSALNEIEGNPHVRARPLLPLDRDAVPWFDSPRAELRLTDAEGGCLSFVMR